MSADKYRRPMQPVEWLAPYANKIAIDSQLSIFYYDLAEHASVQTPLILVHGLADEADTWRHIMLPLARTRRVIALDLPGFGRSSKPAISYTLPVFYRGLIGLLDALSIQHATLVGSSLGGMVSHYAAMQSPERVERLALVGGSLAFARSNISLREQALDMARTAPLLGEYFYNTLRNHPERAYATLRVYYNDIDNLPQTDRDFLFQRVNERVWDDGQRGAYLSTRRNLPRWFVTQRDLPQRIAAVQAPTTAIWGESDHVMPLVHARALVEINPAVKLISLPNVGHLPQQEAPERLLEALHSAIA